jgi:uncharacterized protein YdaU (DUF1376 family)
MSNNPYFQFYPSDWLAGTRGLTASETGVYITLVAMMYEAGHPLEDDRKRLARLCGTTPAAFEKIVGGLLETGKITLDERGFSNRRVENEIKKRTEKRIAASQSANARWKKEQQNQVPTDANAEETQCVRNANQNPDTKIEKKEEPIGSSKKAGSRLPPDWQPDAVFARREGLSGPDCAREADRFRDYWRGQPGQRGVKLDWDATWRNWVRKAVADRRPDRRNAAGLPGYPMYVDGRI